MLESMYMECLIRNGKKNIKNKINLEKQKVWEALNNPEILKNAIP